jgi:hypothetical protein
MIDTISFGGCSYDHCLLSDATGSVKGVVVFSSETKLAGFGELQKVQSF